MALQANINRDMASYRFPDDTAQRTRWNALGIMNDGSLDSRRWISTASWMGHPRIWLDRSFSAFHAAPAASSPGTPEAGALGLRLSLAMNGPREPIRAGQQGPDMAEIEDRGIRSGGRGEDMAGPAVVAYTTEDDAHRVVRQAAHAHALEHGCLLVLYAADAAGFMSEPLPNTIDADGAEDRFGGRLGLADLEYLGRPEIAGQVVEGRDAGARVAAWLPKGHGMAALAEYASAQGAHIVFLPEELASHEELSAKLSGLTDSGGVAPSDIEVRVVGSPASTDER